jgi:GT2 family glycosyltransferase
MGFEEAAGENYWTRMRQEEDGRFVFSKFDGRYAAHIDTKNFAIRADCIKDTMFDPTIQAYEDWDLFLRLKKKGVKIRFLPDLKVRHHHDASLRELWRTQYARARGLERIFVERIHDPAFRDYFKEDESARSHRIWNFFAFVPWAVFQFIVYPHRAPFRVMSDAAWKVGLVVESISIRFSRFRIAITRKLLGI